MNFDIILPTIGRDSLSLAVRSVIDQSYKGWRLYIIGDGVPDEEEITKIQLLDSRISTISIQPRADGYGSYARNVGIGAGSSPWIAYLDDDDVFRSHHLATFAEIQLKDPSVNMIRTYGQEFRMKHKHPRSTQKIRKLGIIHTADILTVGIAHTRELIEKTNGWQPGVAHDRRLWYDMLQAGGNPVISEEVTFEFAR